MWVPSGYSHLQQPNKRQLNVASEHNVEFQESQWQQIVRGQRHQLFPELKKTVEMFPVKLVLVLNFRGLNRYMASIYFPTTLGNSLSLSKPLIFSSISAAVDENLINSS